MAITQWKTFLFPYEQAVNELKVKFKSIRTELRKKNDYSPVEFVTGRVKEINSILEKVNKYDIPIDRIEYELEDIAGIRIMCQFVDDIWTVINIIRERKDMQIVYEKDYVTNVKESGYRSYHIVIKYPVNMSTGLKVILAEIQIRTLAMNFWETIEHSLNYKYRKALPEDVRERLKNAAHAAYKLDEEMRIIKGEIMDAQKLFEIKSSLVTRISDNILALTNLGKHIEAARYREQLNRFLENGEVIDLTNLLSSTEKTLTMYKHRSY